MWDNLKILRSFDFFYVCFANNSGFRDKSNSYFFCREIVSHEQDEEQGIYYVASNEQEMETNCGVSNQKEEKIDKKENDDLPVVLRQKNFGEQQRSEKLDSVNSRDLISFILKSNEDYYTEEKHYR